MKKISSIIIPLIVLFLANSCKEKCSKKYFYNTRVIAFNYTIRTKAKNAIVKIYKTESDYLSDQNVYKTIQLDSTGICSVVDEDQFIPYWVRITNDSLNNLRYGPFDNSNMGGTMEDNGCDKGYNGQYKFSPMESYLSTTPTRLELNVKHAGIGVAGATVQLYYTNSDYINNIFPEYRPKSLVNDFYENEFTLTYFNDHISYNYFLKTTDIDGTVLFDRLEPRQYWFKVISGSMNNSGTIINTTGKLPDDPNITTVLDVGIN